MRYSRWNDPSNYKRVTEELIRKKDNRDTDYRYQYEEWIKHTFKPFTKSTVEELVLESNVMDIRITEIIATSKYLTLEQIYEYVTLSGMDVELMSLEYHVQMMVERHMIQENVLMKKNSKKNLKYYELDYYGYQIAHESGVPFHSGNRYISFSRRRKLSMPEITPAIVKRVLMGNQIVLEYLKSGMKFERFGILETFREKNLELDKTNRMFRASANIRLNEDTTLAYEVVRDTRFALRDFFDKVIRYYKLLDSETYPRNNIHNDRCYPQLIICGESEEHNLKMVQYLKKYNMWFKDKPVLFTEDSLNVCGVDKKIYGFDDNNKKMWYMIKASQSENRGAA